MALFRRVAQVTRSKNLRWRVGNRYTAADAVAQRLKSLALNDTKVLARTIVDWFNRIDRE